jgi:uncharacterized protein (DUF58 family)
VMAAALIAIALIKNINLLLIVGCFTFVLLVMNWWHVRRSLRRLKVSADVPVDAHAGASTRVAIRLHNKGRRSLLRLDYDVQWAGDKATGQVPRLLRDDSITQSRTWRPPRRGVEHSVRITVRHSYPFGLVEARRVEQVAVESWIAPACGDVDLDRLLRGFRSRVTARGQRRLAVRHLSEGTDIHGLRPFRAGDSPRWIHWRTTARVGSPMVRELDRSAGTGLIVTADLTGDHVEAALALLASLVVAWSGHQDGRLLLVIKAKNGWQRFDLNHRRGATGVLRALAEWPDVASANSCDWVPQDIQSGVLRLPIVAVKCSKAVMTPPGLLGQVVHVDPTDATDCYQPAEAAHG